MKRIISIIATLIALTIPAYADWDGGAWDYGTFTWDITIQDPTPAIILDDTDGGTTNDGYFYGTLTDTGAATGDFDWYFQQDVAGTDTTWLHADADGNVNIKNHDLAITTNATPDLIWMDSDAVSGDVNAKMSVNATDGTGGSEDIDISLWQQIAGTLREVFRADADGDVEVRTNDFAIVGNATPDLIWKDSDAVSGDVNAKFSVNASDGTGGSEDIDITIYQQIAGTLRDVLAMIASGEVEVRRSDFAITTNSTPDLIWKDADGVSGGTNAKMSVNLTDTGGGTEDADITIAGEVAGSLTDAVLIDADGDVEIKNHDFAITTNATPDLIWKDSDAVSGDVNAKMSANATDAGGGTEDIDISIWQQIAGTLKEVMRFDADGNVEVRTNDLAIVDNASPGIIWKDSDAVSGDVNAHIEVNATDTGGGTEDIDFSLWQQVAGTDSRTIFSDADVGIWLYPAGGGVAAEDFLAITANEQRLSGSTPSIDFYDKDGTDADLNASIDVNLTATGTGAEMADIEIKGQVAGAETTYALFDASANTTTFGMPIAETYPKVFSQDTGITTLFSFPYSASTVITTDVSVYPLLMGSKRPFQFRGLSTGAGDVDTFSFCPGVTDDAALGTTALMWSDLFLASGAVLNFNNGNATLTHSAGYLTLSTPMHFGAAGTDDSGSIHFIEGTANGTNTARLRGPVSTADVTITLPATTGTVALTGDKLSAFAATSSSELAGVISDETGSGALMFGTSPTFTTSINGASGSQITFDTNDVTITHSANALTFAGGGVGIGRTGQVYAPLVFGWDNSTMAAATTAARHAEMGGNITELADAAITDIVGLYLNTFTITDGGGTETVGNVATAYIAGAPTVGTTPTNGPYALWIDAGATRLDGSVTTGGETGYTPSSDQSRADDSAITVDNTIVRVVGADADALLDTAPAIEDGTIDGQMVIIQGTADANLVTIADNCNVQLAAGASAALGKGDTLQLIWDAGDSDWYEISRSDN